jgi:hypothetical protein
MRVVAKFQFASAAAGADRVVQVIERWVSRKFEQDANGSTIIRTSGLAALLDRLDEKLDDATQTTFRVIEPVSGGQLETQIRVLETAAGIRFQCSLALGSDNGLQPPRVEIRSPRFVREIIELDPGWRVGDEGERVFSKCFEVEETDIMDLEALITAPERRLPVIAVSELQGETIAGNLHERISVATCGLAHTCRLSREASWELTNKVGKEWSCYNGAVRLFWPFRINRDDFRAHPLWTYDYLMSRADNEIAARDRFLHELTERLFEASTFVADDSTFGWFESEKIRRRYDADRVNATEGGDFQALADSYAAENDVLRVALDAATRQNETLQQNVEALTIALRSGQAAAARDSSDAAPPTSVADAAHIARTTLADKVAFSVEIDNQIASLNATAGPPDKVLRHLRSLGDLSQTLSSGNPLGRSVPIWLREKGVECSGESETTKSNKDAKRRRTFIIKGEEIYCEYHTKPSDKVPPDFCVRIYFAVTEQVPCVRVGYIGRHFD